MIPKASRIRSMPSHHARQKIQVPAVKSAHLPPRKVRCGTHCCASSKSRLRPERQRSSPLHRSTPKPPSSVSRTRPVTPRNFPPLRCRPTHHQVPLNYTTAQGLSTPSAFTCSATQTLAHAIRAYLELLQTIDRTYPRRSLSDCRQPASHTSARSVNARCSSPRPARLHSVSAC